MKIRLWHRVFRAPFSYKWAFFYASHKRIWGEQFCHGFVCARQYRGFLIATSRCMRHESWARTIDAFIKCARAAGERQRVIFMIMTGIRCCWRAPLRKCNMYFFLLAREAMARELFCFVQLCALYSRADVFCCCEKGPLCANFVFFSSINSGAANNKLKRYWIN